MKKLTFIAAFLTISFNCFCWGFFGHKKINYYAVFLLPPDMIPFFKNNIDFLTEHAVDPDMRRYAIKEEGPRHYIDIDVYGKYPFEELPRKYEDAINKFGIDSIHDNGIGPWWLQTMLQRLTFAFKEKNQARILKLSAEIGHYIADLHVPLHSTKNHNGQYTGQNGIHGFWESRVPELLADKQFNFFVGKADYIKDPEGYIWDRVLESALAVDSVLSFEKKLTEEFSPDKKFAFENRNGNVIRQYSSGFTIAYNKMLDNMVERRMRQSIYSVASYWYTAWINAGQPDLTKLNNKNFSEEDLKEFEELNQKWKAGKIQSREH